MGCLTLYQYPGLQGVMLPFDIRYYLRAKKSGARLDIRRLYGSPLLTCIGMIYEYDM